jgi:hypothetical protein
LRQNFDTHEEDKAQLPKHLLSCEVNFCFKTRNQFRLDHKAYLRDHFLKLDKRNGTYMINFDAIRDSRIVESRNMNRIEKKELRDLTGIKELDLRARHHICFS